MLRCKQKRAIDLGIIDRLHAKPIASDRQLSFLTIPDRESEHSVEAKQRIDAPLRECVQKNFTVTALS